MLRTIAYLDQLLASEDVLILFRCHLANALQHSFTKGLPFRNLVPSPLVGCLQLHQRHQGSNKCQRQPITINLMQIFFQSLNFSDYNHTMLGLPAVLGFWVSYALVSSATTPTSIPTSTLLSPMSTLTLSTLRWTPFAKVAISTLVLRNIISAPCTPLPSIYMSVAQLLAPISFSLRHPSKLTMADIWYSIHPLRCWGHWLLYIGHRFCIGTAISAASYGLPDHLIKMLSKWSSHAYQIYIHTLISTIIG